MCKKKKNNRGGKCGKAGGGRAAALAAAAAACAPIDVAPAVMHIDPELVDRETLKQIRAMAKHPAMQGESRPVMMPDCHFCPRCTVGTTSCVGDRVVPSFVGGDIGCGVTLYRVRAPLPSNLEAADRRIRAEMRGVAGRGIGIDEEAMRDVLRACDEGARRIGGSIPNYLAEGYVEEVCARVRYPHDLRASIGSLGGGNHFLEVGVGDSDEEYFVCVHSGSRAFGGRVCAHHQAKIGNGKDIDFKEFERAVRGFRPLPREERQAKEQALLEQMRSEMHAPYLEGEEARAYYWDMILAQNVAKANRRALLRAALVACGAPPFRPADLVESVHNYIDFDDMVMRKGAIRAHEGEPCVVALNMRDGVLLCRGRGNAGWNRSCAHGAGRHLTRSEARRRVKPDALVEQLRRAGVLNTSPATLLVDEAPECYKDAAMISELIGESVEVVERVRPALNIKEADLERT